MAKANFVNVSSIRKAIENNYSEYSEKEILGNRYFLNLLQATITSVCKPLNRIPQIVGSYNENSDTTAFTNGETVFVNTAYPSITGITTLWEQYVANVGLVSHESGHVLFTSFPEMNKWIDTLTSDDKFYPANQIVEGSQEYFDFIKKNPNFRRVFVNSMRNIFNIMEDVYIENRLHNAVGGLCLTGLAKLNKAMFVKQDSYNTVLDMCLQGKITPLAVVSYILLIKKTGNKLEDKIEKPLDMVQFALHSVINNKLQECETELTQLETERKGLNRARLLNVVTVKMFELMMIFLKEQNNQNNQNSQQGQNNEQQNDSQSNENEDGNQENNQQNSKSNDSKKGNSKEQSNNSQENEQNTQNEEQSSQNEERSSEGNNGQAEDENQNANNEKQVKDFSSLGAIEYLINEEKLSKQNGSTELPKGSNQAIDEQDYNSQEVEDKKENAKNLAESEESIKRALEAALKEMIEDEVEEQVEEQHSQELKNEARSLLKNFSLLCHDLNGVRISRNTRYFDKESYNDIYSSVQSLSTNLVRRINRILKIREADSSESGYLYGGRFDAKQVFHRDGKYFARKHVPDGRMSVAFGILVDESGSMGGYKINSARRVSILLEDILRKLNIPTMICGHTTSYYDCEIEVFTDFDTYDNNDKYRLANMRAKSSNYDGAAITYMREKLLKRPEEMKILIVISDGLPCGGTYYHRTDPEEDTRLAVASCRKKGIKTFGAILDDYEDIKQIYGEDYSFDCRTDDKLQEQLVKLIKKYCTMKSN